MSPGKEFCAVLSYAITVIPKAATIIDIHTVKEIFSFRNKKPSKAVIKGIAAKHNNVTAAVSICYRPNKVIIAVQVLFLLLDLKLNFKIIFIKFNAFF